MQHYLSKHWGQQACLLDTPFSIHNVKMMRTLLQIIRCVCVIQFNVTFKGISVISCRCQLVADIVLQHLKAISQAHWYSIPPSHSLQLTMGKPTKCRQVYLSFKCRVLGKEASSTCTTFKVFGMAWPGIKPMISHTPGECSTTRPPDAVQIIRDKCKRSSELSFLTKQKCNVKVKEPF